MPFFLYLLQHLFLGLIQLLAQEVAHESVATTFGNDLTFLVSV
ncbi:hypothetical protein T190130A13A_50069 [Tenacibaculum sp. 190130A14a]|uniref:Uncharacterized protein n=1 Tax=Tenacibaculum polynesiense TaxID=3137857 RepID=A0ABM9PEF7_9FLAO